MAKMNKTAGLQGQNQTSGGPHGSHGGHEDSLELPELFCSLGSLIVEGRLPAEVQGEAGTRGYTEGPHVELPGKISRHKCSNNEYLCNKNENFRKHMLLLWQNNVPMSIEILLCSDCGVGRAKARSLEVTTVPEPGSILLEQWTVAVTSGAPSSGHMTGLSLLQAVRSYLHFSQLSAWYSKTGGSQPWNVLMRITIPGEEFSSKFSRPPEQHYFPPAWGGGDSNISVSVRSLPRTDEIPLVICSHSQDTEEEESKLGIAGALAWQEHQDLRRSLGRSRLEGPECAGRLTKSDSMDSMLGDSLLDPPHSLAKMPPRRYQSPSRCGSPSLEAPEPLMGLRSPPAPPPSYEQAVGGGRVESESPDCRLNRHDLLRRRDLTLFGLHPRLFHGHPRLSLPPRLQQPGARRPLNTLPCRAVGEEPALSAPVNDRMPIRCTISGKHICQVEEEEVEEARPDSSLSECHHQDYYRQEELGAKQKGWSSRLGRTSTPYSRDSSSDSSQAEHRRAKSYKPHRDSDCPDVHRHCPIDGDIHQSEMDGVLNFLKSRNSPLSNSKERLPPYKEELLWRKPSRRPSLDDLKAGSCMTQQVFRTEISPVLSQKPDKACSLLLDAILKPHKSESEKLPPGIHTLRETSKYCSQSSGESSSDNSPTSPDYDQLVESERSSLVESPKDEVNHNSKLGCEIYPSCDHVRRSPSPDGSLSVGSLCEELESKCLISRKDVGRLFTVFNNNNNEISNRVRSYSETCSNGVKIPEKKFRPTLQPLDFTFDDYDDNWLSTAESYETYNSSFNGDKRRKSIDEDDSVPSANKKNAFRKSFDSAASMVFQRRTGLPLTSSPAPMRRGIKFDFDSGINTPKDIKRALFEAQSPEESECGSPKKKKRDPRKLLSTSAPATISSNNLLGNFEESVLNGRLEPVSTVEGFTAEIGASGSFQPKHLVFPVTVFFYTLCENSNYASPYLGHINLGKKGYRIPERGTIQLTLFNPLGTVVKMFVVMYDLADMPSNSQTFLRQRTLYMPSDKTDSDPEAQKWLRYLIHLRVTSSKSGKIYLHTDVRMIIFRKSDLDTATEHESGKGWELRSFTRGPTNPKFSPRK